MNYVLAVFRARTQTLAFAKILDSYRIRCSVVNTPRQVLVACGVSVRFNEKDFEKALTVMSRRRFDNFVGFYRVSESNNSFIVVPMN